MVSTCEEKESPQLGPQKGRKEMPFPAIMFALVRIFAVLGPAVAASIGASVVTVKNDKGVEVVESIHAIQLKAAAPGRLAAAKKAEMEEELRVTIKLREAMQAWIANFGDELEVTTAIAQAMADVRLQELELSDKLGVPVEEFRCTHGAPRTSAQISALREKAGG